MVAHVIYRGLPPFGLGYYVRAELEPRPAFRFAAVNAWRRDRAEQVRALRAAGVTPWLYGTPERFQPRTWRDGVDYIEREAIRLGVEGFIGDGETLWPELSSAERAREGAAFGARMAAAAENTRVGFTSYPSWPALTAFAREAGGRVFGSPQIYGRSALSRRAFASWLDGWRAAFGERCIPSIAGWAARPSMSNAAGFDAYMDLLPPAAGAIVWDGGASSAFPAYVADGLARWRMSPAAATAIVAGHVPFVAIAALAMLLAVAFAYGKVA